MRTLLLSIFLATGLAADVVVLKAGTRVPGRVVDKGTHYEVTTEGVLRTFLKDEVEKIVTSPKEFLGDADKIYEEVKSEYHKAIDISDAGRQNQVLKDLLSKLARAREAYSTTLDLFPESDGLGKQLMLIMQLTRLLRERKSSEVAVRAVDPSRPAPPRPEPPPTIIADDAVTVLLDPAKRADANRRLGAIGSLKSQRASDANSYDLATAAMVFLSKSDAEMKLEGPALKAVQEYFDKPWLKDPRKLTAAAHLQAAQYLAERIPALKKPDTAAAADALQAFAIAHLSCAPAGPDVDKAARAVGLAVQNGVPGTPEGHAVRDLNGWIAEGDFDLAVLAFIREYRSIDTPTVRFVWSYALLRLVQSRKRGFERPVSALETVKVSFPAAQDHVAALVKSIKAVAVCSTCAGQGKLRCTNCHGKKTIIYQCLKCKGKGNTTNQFGAQLLCLPCKGTGNARALVCDKCADGYFDCKQCDKERTPPELDDILSMQPCAGCDGRGLLFRKANVPCKACLGLGQKLVPRADPSKVLP